MSKELEALNILRDNHIQFTKEKYRKLDEDILKNIINSKLARWDILEEALKKLEIIKKIEEFFSIDFAELFNNGLKIKNISITYTLGEICGGTIEFE